MPGKQGEGVFSIKELSPEARERVLEEWRYKIWDDHDSDFLSDTFKEILSERGFSKPEVCWGLGHSQGDGVAFWGYIDPPDFFKWIFSGDKKAKPFSKQAKPFVFLQDILSIKVTHSGNYCHSNSMDVEIEVTGEEMDLVPEKYRREVSAFYENKLDAFAQWQHAKREVDENRLAPIREWQRRMRARSEMLKRGPKEWRPAMNPPSPEPLDLPYPPEPSLMTQARIERMLDEAVRKWSEIGVIANAFEKFVDEWVKDTSRELEKLGYDEMEYRQSDEAITEFLEANEFEFDEEGEGL